MEINIEKILFSISILNEYTVLEYFFRKFVHQCEFDTCVSLLYLNKSSYNIFIKYYNIPFSFKDFFIERTKELNSIYKKYKYYFLFSGSFLLNKIHNIGFNDIDIFVMVKLIPFRFIGEHYKDGKKYYYTLDNKINDLIFSLKQLGYKKKNRIYNFSDYKMIVFCHKQYKEQFIFVNRKECISYGLNNRYHFCIEFEKFLNTFDLSCVQFYFNFYNKYIKSKYPQIKNEKYTVYKHQINDLNELIDIVQPYRLIKYLNKGYKIKINENIEKLIYSLNNIMFIYNFLEKEYDNLENNINIYCQYDWLSMTIIYKNINFANFLCVYKNQSYYFYYNNIKKYWGVEFYFNDFEDYKIYLKISEVKYLLEKLF